MSTLSSYGEETPEDDDTFDIATFESGVEKRVSIILLLDTSSSMAPQDEEPPWPIHQLNDALRDWSEALRTNSRLMHRAEVAIITFGKGGVTTHDLGDGQTFAPAATLQPPQLEAGGVTPMMPAIKTAIELAESRKRQLDELRIMRFRPLVFMITDGAPTDSEGKVLPEAGWAPTGDEIAALEERKKLAFFGVGVRGSNNSVLQRIARNGFWHLGDGDFSEFLRLVSSSASAADPITAAREHLARLHG
ncbi:uncharacterized protein YegL [Geodermatophilus bullaregiensis]|uniref:vWA domain-containing protein n=1 Tax=Geodermatophilus bullaregiensis TaxID=1564160 RepID=UPI0019573B8F|nr:VWA domain-containing protein [Geodermatophilus bullaregiensis]MBM7804186.1 uncharacterized protein YegL [Geodermatophilus bullaregiensis]